MNQRKFKELTDSLDFLTSQQAGKLIRKLLDRLSMDDRIALEKYIVDEIGSCNDNAREIYKGVICRGSVILRTGCGTCAKCLDEIEAMKSNSN